MFRDEDEIPASADLSDQIKQALARSSILIVVCSPDTPNSRWIRREIELFQEMGKGDRIVPLLVDGEPHESFPPELLRVRCEGVGPNGEDLVYWEDVEPVAADVRPRKGERASKTKQRAVLRLAAAILGCRFDDLYQRDLQRRRSRQRAIAASVIAFTGVVGAGAGWYWDRFVREKTALCANYGERWGVPFCVGRLSTDLAGRQTRYYRLTSVGGRVIEMTRLNGSGHLSGRPENPYEAVAWASRAARFSYIFNDKGRLARVRQFARNGRFLREHHYTFDDDRTVGVVRFERDIGQSERQTAGSTRLGSPMELIRRGRTGTVQRRAAIGQHRLRFDGSGLLLERRFEALGGGKSIPDDQGAYGQAYRYGALGLIESIRNLDAVGDTLIERTGVAEFKRQYDESGRLVVVSWFDKAGRPVFNDQHFARLEVLRNDFGQAIQLSYLDTAGRPTLHRLYGVARVAHTYDARGHQQTRATYGADGRPILSKRLGAAKVIRTVDERGNETSILMLGIDGKPVRDKRFGIAEVRIRYDDQGNRVEESSLGPDGLPALRRGSEVASRKMRYDAQGRMVEMRYSGVDGKPKRDRFGIAIVKVGYDANGNVVERAFFGPNGEPTLHRRRGAARIGFAYDERGNQTQITHFGIDGRPAPARRGVTRIALQHDPSGNLVEESYFDADGKPVLQRGTGVARLTYDYDTRGNRSRSPTLASMASRRCTSHLAFTASRSAMTCAVTCWIWRFSVSTEVLCRTAVWVFRGSMRRSTSAATARKCVFWMLTGIRLSAHSGFRLAGFATINWVV